jgi:prophage regulatory protein
MQISATASHPGRDIRYLRQPQVLARVGVSWITLRRWEAQGKFPKRRRLGPNSVAWLEHEIDEWCASRAIADEAEVA